MSYQAQHPVLLRVFRRPDTTQRVIDRLREVKPPRLYVAGDGPRPADASEIRRVKCARQVATEIDWECNLKTLFWDHNLGGPAAGIRAIDWFFHHEESGIILEDDTLPNEDFFRFCDEILSRYKDDPRVYAVTGDNFQGGRCRGSGSYYFSKYNHVWGWASWRRAWSGVDLAIGFWPTLKDTQQWRQWLPDRVERHYWEDVFDQLYQQEILHWDYAWTAYAWYRRGLTITPNVNLVANIGFGSEGTNTKNTESAKSNMATGPIGVIHHPATVRIDQNADSKVFDTVFGGRWRRWPFRWLLFGVRFFRAQRPARRVYNFLQSKGYI